MGDRHGADIFERLLDLSARGIRVAGDIRRVVEGRHIALQLVRAVTSAGANYQEARYSESRADFVHKIGVAVKELAETLYWLQLIERLRLTPRDLDRVTRETHELLAILIASARTARASLR